MNPRPSDPRLDDDARRAAACLHACEGIPTEALESQVILRLVAACVSLRDPRLREVLEEMSVRPPGRRVGPASRRRNLRALPGRAPAPPGNG
jgi:hypothetical protein